MPIRDEKDQEAMQGTRVDIALIKQKLVDIEKTLGTLVTKIEFTPVKILVYGLCGSVLTGVIGAIMTKVLTK